MKKSQYLLVGQIGKPHGTKGGLRVNSYSDYPQISFAPGTSLRLGDHDGNFPSLGLEFLKVDSARIFGAGLLVHFDGVFNRSAAGALTSRSLFLAVEEVAELQEGEYFWHDLVGMEVVDLEASVLGKVSSVYELSPLDLLEVSGPGSSFMIPCSQEIIVSVDLENQRIVVDPPEGLLGL